MTLIDDTAREHDIILGTFCHDSLRSQGFRTLITLIFEERHFKAGKRYLTAKGGLILFWELFTVIPCAPKDFKR